MCYNYCDLTFGRPLRPTNLEEDIMYRYTHATHNARFKRRQTLFILALLLLCIVAISLGFAYVRASRINHNTRDVLVARIKTEASHARNSAYLLSQTSGSNIESTVASVRKHVHATQVLNEMTSSIYGPGALLVDETLIKNCTNALDECDTKLKTGATLIDAAATLRLVVDALFNQVELLE